jgi:hypothetical protein
VLARVVRYRHFVRKEIEIKRLIFSRGTELLGLGADLFGAQHAGWQTSEPARLCGRDCKLGVRCSRHWRLEDRDVDREKIQNSSVRPHRLAPIATLVATLALSIRHMNSRRLRAAASAAKDVM